LRIAEEEAAEEEEALRIAEEEAAEIEVFFFSLCYLKNNVSTRSPSAGAAARQGGRTRSSRSAGEHSYLEFGRKDFLV